DRRADPGGPRAGQADLHLADGSRLSERPQPPRPRVPHAVPGDLVHPPGVTVSARAVTDNLVVAQRLWTTRAPILARRYGLANATRRGVVCFSAVSFPEPFGDLAIGFGVGRPPAKDDLDAVLAHYAA